MQRVESLVERARHLSLHPTTETPLDTFHSTVDSHLQKIYESLSTQKVTSVDFFNHIQRDESSPEGQLDPLSSLDAFRAYMKNPASRALGEAKEMDLSAPISDYYVSSSHNTYLTGNQLYSDAAASAYTSVLLHGCRSVEIDVWDGEPKDADSDGETSCSESSDNEVKKSTLKSRLKATIKSKLGSEEKAAKELLDEKLHRKSSTPANVSASNEQTVAPVLEPRVLHGHTLTKGTSFREICYAIRDAAFVNSDLPVIISFEVHACLEQQQMMVDIVNDAWKGLLVEVPSDVEPAKLPTLGELKRKILIKTKSTPLQQADLKAELEEASEPSAEASDQSVDAQQKPAKPSKILEALAKLAVYTRAYHFTRFDQPEAKVPHVFSLSERAARDAHTNYRDALFEHNRCSLMRIYPYALRVTSSNLDPAFHWRRGAQLVALNWQNLDKGMMLNHGMFAGTQGWALKPRGYRSSEGPADSITRTNIELKIEVFAGQDLALPQNHSEKGFKPYVVCQLHVEEPEGPAAADRDDASDDTDKSSYRRHTKTASGRNPDFEAQGLVFPTVVGVVEELSFVRFKIKDDEFVRDSLAAWACIRLDQLREGYRFIHLHDSTGLNAGGVLLVRISKRIS
ncbi:uncharacterized protein N7484_007568 [Penicillium longicatenatum]|uniref:uncharacterized protein n=1 Tax=Penicillium longicatenatum TaxID=1561947 RepID=UPI0025475DDD|nr:uncharacterized protein N7484_007568 [Penicillium longicatenatum]KAJ5639706.1 hypothetical protein N7484_007568 [Penicillium longicatenatum]